MVGKPARQISRSGEIFYYHSRLREDKTADTGGAPSLHDSGGRLQSGARSNDIIYQYDVLTFDKFRPDTAIGFLELRDALSARGTDLVVLAEAAQGRGVRVTASASHCSGKEDGLIIASFANTGRGGRNRYDDNLLTPDEEWSHQIGHFTGRSLCAREFQLPYEAFGQVPIRRDGSDGVYFGTAATGVACLAGRV